MITTGKYFEEIVEMLNNFRSEVKSVSALGYTNINKHSENFLKRILNLVYDYELENLNKEKTNFPGLDLGNTEKQVAFQITATKTSEKIDDALTACLKYEHYKIFKEINVFILTNKQSSYTIKTITQPNFTFSPETNIKDFDDLFKALEHLDPITIKNLNEYVKSELQPVIESLKAEEPEVTKFLLNIDAATAESKMPRFRIWRSKIYLKSRIIPVPKMYAQLNTFLPRAIRNQFLQIFNDTLRKKSSNQEILYTNPLQRDPVVVNYFYGAAMLLEPSSITIERAAYTNGVILSNLLTEMVMLLTSILFFANQKTDFEMEVTVEMESNTDFYFHPQDSLVLQSAFNSFKLSSPFNTIEVLQNTQTSKLADLLQQIMYGFISDGPNVLNSDPFITISRNSTEFVINNIKRELGIG